jgi:hypothetical protein
MPRDHQYMLINTINKSTSRPCPLTAEQAIIVHFRSLIECKLSPALMLSTSMECSWSCLLAHINKGSPATFSYYQTKNDLHDHRSQNAVYLGKHVKQCLAGLFQPGPIRRVNDEHLRKASFAETSSHNNELIDEPAHLGYYSNSSSIFVTRVTLLLRYIPS